MEFVYKNGFNIKLDESQALTQPGYMMKTENWSLTFVSAMQNGALSDMLEMETDWKEVMMIIMTVMELEMGLLRKVRQKMKEKIEEWSLQQEGGVELNLKVNATINDKTAGVTGRSKSLTLRFNDVFKTVILFSVTKVKKVQSLKTLSSAVVSDLVKKPEDVEKLEIPRTLFEDIEEAGKDVWRPKTQFIKVNRKRKVEETFSNLMQKIRDCPFCGRGNFKKLKSHISKNVECKLKFKLQVEYRFIEESCYW